MAWEAMREATPPPPSPIRSLAHIEQDNVQGDVQIIAHMMETSVMAAHDAIVGKAKRERRLAGMGTTVTSVALVAGYWVLAHIGDSRAISAA